MTIETDNKFAFWNIAVDRKLWCRTEFSEPVTYAEAIRLYNEGLFEDIIDEDIEEDRAVDADPC